MNLFSYIDKYGNKSFEEMKFNEVDNIIFSSLSYVSLDKYVSHNSFGKRSIKDVGDDYFKNYNKKEKNIIAVKNGIKVLRYIKDTKRYGDLFLYNYSYIGDNKEQFSAITIEIDNNLVYVSFEGTDQLISGWKEDFMFSYMFPVLSQRRAISSINKHFLLGRKKIILGGHSKGGNLAIVAGMYANYFIKKRIINIYNNDGPGFRIEQLNSKQYKNIENKIIRIVPNYSFFGLLLNHSKKCIVVKSFKKGLWAHSVDTWVVDDKKLMRDKLSDFSILLNRGMKKWINQYDYEVRERFVKSLFLIFDRANVKSVVDVLKNKKLIIKLVMEYNGTDREVKEMMKNFVHVVFKYLKEHKNDEIDCLFEEETNGKE